MLKPLLNFPILVLTVAAQGHPTLVKPETFNQLTTPMPGQDYAGGWIVFQRNWAGGRALTHEGNNTVFCANVWIAPEKDFAVLIATNYGGNGVAKAIDDAASTLIGINSSVIGQP